MTRGSGTVSPAQSPPRNADSTRAAHLSTLLRGRVAGYALALGTVGGFLFGAAIGSTLVMAGAPLAVAALVLGLAFRTADGQAAEDFFIGFAAGHGLNHYPVTELLPLTPLLGAGDRRRCEHQMEGPLGAGAPDLRCGLGLYTYETRDHADLDGDAGWRPHHFTICVVDIEPGIVLFPGVFLERRRDLVGMLAGERWLDRHGRREVQLESAAFADRYELVVDGTQDEVRLRELFAPSFVIWLAEHPLAPCFEYRAGTLVVYVPRRLTDAGSLNLLLAATAEIAGRLVDEITEEPGLRPR
jgi:hypothetical protein